MNHRWRKLGQLYCSGGMLGHEKLLSHAANPLPVHIEGDVYRVFFSGRDVMNRSSVGAVDIDIVARKVVREHAEPFFVHGLPGTFYSEGVSVGNCYKAAGRTYMVFMGWQNAANAHWRGDVGRLVVGKDLGLSLEHDNPLLPVDATDPISFSYPWVMAAHQGGYDMYYGTTLDWDAGNGEMLHVIQHAQSDDGEHWKKHGLAVPFELGVAQAFSRPTVVRDADGLYMWFSYRGEPGRAYRIGHAFRPVGGEWSLRIVDAGIDVSVDGWDSDMIEYPFVLDHNGERYMLYNGNDYGRTGFGLAIADRG